MWSHTRWCVAVFFLFSLFFLFVFNSVYSTRAFNHTWARSQTRRPCYSTGPSLADMGQSEQHVFYLCGHKLGYFIAPFISHSHAILFDYNVLIILIKLAHKNSKRLAYPFTYWFKVFMLILMKGNTEEQQPLSTCRLRHPAGMTNRCTFHITVTFVQPWGHHFSQYFCISKAQNAKTNKKGLFLPTLPVSVDGAENQTAASAKLMKASKCQRGLECLTSSIILSWSSLLKCQTN